MSKQVDIQIFSGSLSNGQTFTSEPISAEGYRRMQLFGTNTTSGTIISAQATSATLADIFNNTAPPETPTDWVQISGAILGGINSPATLPADVCAKYIRVVITASGGATNIAVALSLGDG